MILFIKNRTSFHHAAAWMLFTFGCLVFFGYLTSPAVAGQPNIIVVLADDLGWNDVGYHGSEIRTPNLDTLADEGLQLDRFYVHPMCTPTRAALMTGKYPHRLGMADVGISPWDKAGLPLDEITIAQTLQEAGYFTAIIGKWHLGHYNVSYLPTRRGFNYHYGHYGGGIDYFDHTYPSTGGGRDWHRNEVPVKEDGYATDLLGNEAVQLIGNHDFKTPLFLYVAFNAPHSPLQAKEEDIKQYAGIKDVRRRIFAAQVQCMDSAISRIIQSLKDKGVWKSTFFLFFSDNGGATPKPWTRGDNRPLRGQKGTLYEGGMRVPAILSYPSTLKGGMKIDIPIHVVDLYPTFVKLAGLQQPACGTLGGVDVLPAISKNFTERSTVLLHYNDSSAAILSGNYKLLKNGLGWFRNSYYDVIELFDVKNDPNEKLDLSESQPEIVANMLKRLTEFEDQAVPSILSKKSRPKGFVVPNVWLPDGLGPKIKPSSNIQTSNNR